MNKMNPELAFDFKVIICTMYCLNNKLNTTRPRLLSQFSESLNKFV